MTSLSQTSSFTTSFTQTHPSNSHNSSSCPSGTTTSTAALTILVAPAVAVVVAKVSRLSLSFTTSPLLLTLFTLIADSGFNDDTTSNPSLSSSNYGGQGTQGGQNWSQYQGQGANDTYGSSGGNAGLGYQGGSGFTDDTQDVNAPSARSGGGFGGGRSAQSQSQSQSAGGNQYGGSTGATRGGWNDQSDQGNQFGTDDQYATGTAGGRSQAGKPSITDRIKGKVQLSSLDHVSIYICCCCYRRRGEGCREGLWTPRLG